MRLESGFQVGPYEVIAPLGAGGMGEVYRARDSRLNRDVALKLLPDLVAADRERAARFQREAQLLASLNHTHIAQIYGVEESTAGTALVMEFVDGQTLAARMEPGPMPLDDALTIARQVAEAVEAAHDKGIVHRDLKPGNVMTTSAGAVKVLDFGLAGFTPTEPSSAVDAVTSPALTIAATQAGMILGTAAYMSPEQAAGKAVDKRADIWSFGVVLWELLTGRRLFNGETISHTIADVLRAPIDFGAVRPDTPAAVRELLRRCLDRDPRTRLRDIGEARVALESALKSDGSVPHSADVVAPHTRTPRLVWIALSVAAVAVTAAVALALARYREAPATAATVRFELMPPADKSFINAGVLSPDGRMIVFDAAGPDGRPMLWVRALDSLQARPLAGTEGAVAGPFWSPDSRQIGFGITSIPRQLKRVDVVSGVTETLAEFPGYYREGTWNADGDIVFGEAGTGLWRIRVPGGSPVQVTALDAKRGEIQHAEPVFLPGGKQFLYHRTARTGDQSGIFIGTLDAKPGEQSTDRLLASDSGPVFARGEHGGFILFVRDGILLAQAFDGARLESDPIRVAENIGGVGSHGWFSASATGALIYRSRQDAGFLSELAWLDRSGARVGQIGSAANFNTVQLSPNGRRVLTTRSETTQLTAPRFSPDGRQVVQTTAGARLWIADVARGIFGQVFPENAPQGSPAISNDDRIAYTSTINGAIGDIYLVSATGIGTPEPLIVKSSTIKHPNHFSPDGRYLIYDDHTTSQKQDLYVLPIKPDSTGARTPIPFLVTPADETFGQFSPDGRWVAYTSDESGRREVFVQGFAPDRVPATAVGKWTISTAGGDKPRWSADGRELYYLSPDRKLMAVPIARGATFEPGVPKALFDVPLITGFFPYDVAPDGRFVFNVIADAPKTSASPLTVVLNWQSALR